MNLLNSLAGTGWGCQKETLLKVYRTYFERALNYAAAIWTPNASDTSFKNLQRIPNRAICIATGCHANTDISHLHNETKITLLSSQFLLGCHRVSHSSHELVWQNPGARQMKNILSTKYTIFLFINTPFFGVEAHCV